MIRIAVIVGSTRPGRRARQVADWVTETAARHPAIKGGEAVLETVDLADHGLPLLDEPVPAAFGRYSNPHTVTWSETIGSFDGYVFVTPEYNHSIPAALKNAIDFLFTEWNDKAAGFVGYGTTGGIRAVEQLRLMLAEVKVAGVRSQVALSLFTDFRLTDPSVDPGVLVPGEHQEPTLMRMLDELVAWTRAFKALRESAAQPVGA